MSIEDIKEILSAALGCMIPFIFLFIGLCL